MEDAEYVVQAAVTNHSASFGQASGMWRWRSTCLRVVCTSAGKGCYQNAHESLAVVCDQGYTVGATGIQHLCWCAASLKID
jgi:hypothetical protein